MSKSFKIIALAVVIAGFGIVGAVNTDRILAQWSEWTGEEPYTELYFKNPKNLPQTYAPNESQQFRFSFLNREDKVVEYSFKITAEGEDGQTDTIGRGSADSRHNQIGTVNPAFQIPDLGKRVKIIVELSYEDASGQPQSKMINFWVNRAPASEKTTFGFLI